MLHGIRRGCQRGREGLKRVHDCSCHRKLDKNKIFLRPLLADRANTSLWKGGSLQGNAQGDAQDRCTRDRSVTLCDTVCPLPDFLSEPVYRHMVIITLFERDESLNFHTRPVNPKASKPSSRPRRRPKRSFSRPVNVWMALPPHLVIHSFRTLVLLRRSHTKAQGCPFGGNQGD